MIDDEGRIKISLYKALLFLHISDGIKSGILNLKYSYKYKSFEDYLIPKDEFILNKKDLLSCHELEYLEDFKSLLYQLQKNLKKALKLPI